MARLPTCLRIALLVAAVLPVAAMNGVQARGQAPGPTSSQASGSVPAQPQFTYFFTETNRAFEAYMDSGHMTVDADGNRLVTVKLTKFNDTFRMWIKTNFPDGEDADYAIDQYSIDCEGKMVGEHQIVWYDAKGNELTDYDFGGDMNAPITYSMKDILMKRVCGLQ